MNLPSLPQDKANHVIYGAVIALLAYIIAKWTYPQAAMWISLVASTGLGLIKEASDWWQNRKGGNHGVELWDAVATAAGGILVMAPLLISK